MKKAAVLWTGGKDSFLALLEAREEFAIQALVTFVPDPPQAFLAHPLELIRAQAGALGLEHRAVPVGAPFAESYERAIDALAEEGIEVLVTGDMARVDGHNNWIVERARGVVEVVRPLWGRDRVALLRSLVEQEIEVLCTLHRLADFETAMAGEVLNAAKIEELIAREGVEGFDACGENGEYHTCVLEAPAFAHGLRLDNPRVETTGEYAHLVFDSVGEQPSTL